MEQQWKLTWNLWSHRGYSGSRVYNQCLHWALKFVNIVYAGLFAFLSGLCLLQSPVPNRGQDHIVIFSVAIYERNAILRGSTTKGMLLNWVVQQLGGLF